MSTKQFNSSIMYFFLEEHKNIVLTKIILDGHQIKEVMTRKSQKLAE